MGNDTGPASEAYLDSSNGTFWFGFLHEVDRYPDTLYAGCNLYRMSGGGRNAATQTCRRPAETEQARVEPEVERERPPSLDEELREAVRHVSVPGSGLVVQPSDVAYTGVPTLVHARVTEREISVDVLGLDVPIRLEARSFAFDFGDDTAPLVTSDPGAPYPDKSNQHTYLAPARSVVITLRTTWSATARNPASGETLELEEPLHSEELSTPFEVRKPVVLLTDDAEERLGH